MTFDTEEEAWAFMDAQVKDNPSIVGTLYTDNGREYGTVDHTEYCTTWRADFEEKRGVAYFDTRNQEDVYETYYEVIFGRYESNRGTTEGCFWTDEHLVEYFDSYDELVADYEKSKREEG